MEEGTERALIDTQRISVESLHASWVRNGFLAANVGTTLVLVGLSLRTTIGETTFTKVLAITTLFLGLATALLGFLYATLSTHDYKQRMKAIKTKVPLVRESMTKWIYPIGIGQAIVVALLLLVLTLIIINNGFD